MQLRALLTTPYLAALAVGLLGLLSQAPGGLDTLHQVLRVRLLIFDLHTNTHKYT